MTTASLTLMPGQLDYPQMATIYEDAVTLSLEQQAWSQIETSAQRVEQVLANHQVVYGINTGFGQLQHKKISTENLQALQTKLVLSHAAGVGDYLSPATSRLILALKINALAQGFSGVRVSTAQCLLDLLNKGFYPCIPAQGSVGASGDLAPLAHMAAVLLGHGEVYHQGSLLTAKDALKKLGMEPIEFSPKEGLALLNGTQVSTALAIEALLRTQQLFQLAMITGSLSVEACKGSHVPFDDRFYQIRGSIGARKVAATYRELLADSEIYRSHQTCSKVQDPYSLRCQAIVMGACLDQMDYIAKVLLAEANGVTDNPLIFSDKEILSGGNFHGQSVAFAMDALACVIAEIGSIAERRIALMTDPHMSQLPPFLVEDAGLNSGFMIAHVTASALVSENKCLAHPTSVDSIPTSANQEDHVSMATHGARRCLTMINNLQSIIAIELLASAQGIEFSRPLKTTMALEKVISRVRKQIAPYDQDRYFATDINTAKGLMKTKELIDLTGVDMVSCF